MTRFIITLDESVNLVIKAFERMEGGEVFVPKIPSTTILDIARAVDPNCKTKVIGIRPGEKLHECMIPSDEARHTLEFDDHYVIQPAFRSWSSKPPAYAAEGRACAEGFNYSSDNNAQWLSIEQLRTMIHRDSVKSMTSPRKTQTPAQLAPPPVSAEPEEDAIVLQPSTHRQRVTKAA